MKTVDVSEAIALAKEHKSLDGLAIKNLEETQVKAVDAIALAEGGVLIPEQNIIYRDEDVKYDPEFDDYEWRQLPANTSLADLSNIAAKIESKKQPVLQMEIEVEDEKTLQWASDNYSAIKNILNGLVKELYSSRTIIK